MATIKAFGFTAGVVTMLSAPALVTAQDGEVTIGYQPVYNPYKVGIVDEEFEKRTGYTIDWRQFDSGSRVITAMASGAVDIAMAGSSPIAAGVSRGLDMQLFWIMEGIAEGEALVVSQDSGIKQPEDLKGKTIAVPFVSTTHYHMMFALDSWGIAESEVNLLNMQPNQAAAAWERGDIDGAFVWNPSLGRMKADGGEVLITSGELCEMGKCTFDGVVVSPEFAEANPEFMAQWINIVDEYNEQYRSNTEAWSADSDMVEKIVQIVGGDAGDVPVVLSEYIFPSLEEQASGEWLGGGAEGGAATALLDTASFLKEQGKVSAVPEDIGEYVTDEYVKAAMEQK